MDLIGKLSVLILIFYSTLLLSYLILTREAETQSKLSKSISTYSLIQSNLKEISSDSNSEICKVRHYPFSDEELRTHFNYKNYSRCPVAKDVIFSYKNHVLEVECKKSQGALYSTQLRKSQQLLGGGVRLNVFWRKTKDNKNNQEFSFVRCSERSIHASVFNKFNQQIADRANKIKSGLNPKSKKMSVLVLVFDSISKYNYQRYFKKTIEFLNRLNTDSNNFSYHEFEKSVTPNHFTTYNIAQIVFGRKLEDLNVNTNNDFKPKMTFPKSQKDNQKHAIWNFYKKLGYTTMFLHDSVWDYISKITGRIIETDHSFVDFWKYAWGVYNWHDFTNGQRCAGSKNSHDLSFDYTYQYFDNYKDNNKFAYVHLNAAHESSGNVQTIDEDLVSFLDDFLKMIERKGESLALLMISDHGFKHMNMIRWDYRGFYEIHVPMTHLIISKDIKIELDPLNNLEKNKEKLISRLELNLVMKQLAYFPYNLKFDLNDLKNYEFPVYSFLSEEIPLNRTCSEIGVAKEHCLCSWYTEVNTTIEREIIVKDTFIELLNEFFENNSKFLLSCSPMVNFSLTDFKSFQLQDLESDLDTLYYFQYDFEGITIKAIGNFCLKPSNTKETIIKEDQRLVLPFTFFDIPEGLAFLQVNEVEIDEKCFSDICKCKDEHLINTLRF